MVEINKYINVELYYWYANGKCVSSHIKCMDKHMQN